MTLQRQLDKVGGRQSWLILPPFSRCKPTPNWLEQFHSDLKHAERHGTYNPLHHCPFHFDCDVVLDYCYCSTRLAHCQSVRLRPWVDQSSLHHITDLVGPLDCPSSGHSNRNDPQYKSSSNLCPFIDSHLDIHIGDVWLPLFSIEVLFLGPDGRLVGVYLSIISRRRVLVGYDTKGSRIESHIWFKRDSYTLNEDIYSLLHFPLCNVVFGAVESHIVSPSKPCTILVVLLLWGDPTAPMSCWYLYGGSDH